MLPVEMPCRRDCVPRRDCILSFKISCCLYGLVLQAQEGEAHGSGPINLACGGKETPWTAMLALEVSYLHLLQPCIFDLVEPRCAQTR